MKIMIKFDYTSEDLPNYELTLPHLWQFRCGKVGDEFVSLSVPVGFDLGALQEYVKEFFLGKIPKMTYFHGLALQAMSSGTYDELQEATVIDMQVSVDQILSRMELVNLELRELYSLHGFPC